MIVTCPNCAARYRLSDTALARPARLKCAACGHRWLPEADSPAATAPPPPPAKPLSEADEDAAMRAVQDQIRARWQDAAAPVVPVPAAGDITEQLTETPARRDDFEPAPAQEPAARSTLLRNLVAVIAGTALAIAAAGLWIGQRNLGEIPMMGEVVKKIAPPVPVELTIAGTTSDLSSGSRVLEVTGLIINRSKGVVTVPSLAATLAGPDGVALRWTIPPPRRQLGPDQQVAFTSTVTGFPESATQLQVRALQ